MRDRGAISTRILIGAIAWLGMSTLGFAQIVNPGPPERPIRNPRIAQNILLVIADDLGIEALGSYQTAFGITGVTAATTPNIDSLQTNGVTFLNVWSNPMCTPSRAGIFSGKHVFNHGLGHPKDVTAAGGESLEASLAGDAALPEMLPGTYRSGLFGKWHLGGVGDPNVWISGGFYDSPRNLGWETHDGSWEEISDPETYCDWMTTVDGTCTALTTDADVGNYATTYVVDHALAWIDSVKSSPWFATVALNAPHEPLHDPTDMTCAPCAAEARACFLDLVGSADTAVGDLIAGLSDNNELKDTIIIFVGDNGTGYASATIVDADPDPDYTIPYPEGHWKTTVYQGGVHVPLIIADGCYLANGVTSKACKTTLPQTRIKAPGRSEDALVHTLDLFATIAQLAHSTADYTLRDSISMWPYLVFSYTPNDLREYLYTEGDDSDGIPMCAIRDAQYKLIIDPCYQTNADGCELYDLTAEAYGAESDDILPGATALPSALADLVFELKALRGWGSHPCTDWVVPLLP